MTSKTLISIILVLNFISMVQGTTKSIVRITDHDAIPPDTIRGIRFLVKSQLSKLGYLMLDIDDSYDRADDVQIIAWCRDNEADLVFDVAFLRLGRKLICVMTKKDSGDMRVIFSEQASAANIEELDTVLPRLISSVHRGKPVEETAEMTMVTEKEAEPFKKKPGELFWGVSLPTGTPLVVKHGNMEGFFIRSSYEMERSRIDFDIGGMGDAASLFDAGIRPYYIFSPRNISAFIGGGLSYFAASVRADEGKFKGSGMALSLGGGVEFFRLYETRLVVSFDVIVPLFKLKREYQDNGQTRHEKKTVPFGIFKLTYLW